MISFIPVDELWQYPERFSCIHCFFVYKYNVDVIKICSCVATVSYLRKGNENKYKDSLSKEKEYKQYVRVLSI